MSASPVTAPWAALVEMAEVERDLALVGRWEEVAALAAERVRRALALPPAPHAALPHLQRLGELQAELAAMLVAARSNTVRELGALRRGQNAAAGYAAAGAPQRGSVDTTS